MNYREIISEAWLFTQENKRLIVWYAFIPSVLSTVVGAFYLAYQIFAFKGSVFFENWQDSFLVVVLRELYKIAQQYAGSLIPIFIILGILALLYFLLPPVVEGAMIQIIARRRNQQQIRIRDGLRYGFMSFLPLFNYSLIARTFSLIGIGGEAALIARSLGYASSALLPILIIVIVISIIFSILFIFTEYYIVIDNCSVTEAMAKSATLTIKHLNAALMLYFLMLIIAVRIMLQIIFVLLLPMLIFTAIYVLAASSFPFFGIVVGALFSFLALIFVSYLGAIIHVFTASVWVFSFLDLTSEPEVSAREKVDI